MIADDNLPMYKNRRPLPGPCNHHTYKNKALSPELQTCCSQNSATKLLHCLNTSAKADKHLWTRMFGEGDCFQKILSRLAVNCACLVAILEIDNYCMHTALLCNHRGMHYAGQASNELVVEI